MIYPIRSRRPSYRRGGLTLIHSIIAIVLSNEALNREDGDVAVPPRQNLAMPHGYPMDGLVDKYAHARHEAAFVAPIFRLVDEKVRVLACQDEELSRRRAV